MINTIVEVSGLLVDCNLLEDKGKYFVHIIPESPAVIEDIERRIFELKNEPEENLPGPPEEDFESDEWFNHKDRYLRRTGMSTYAYSTLAFESDRPPSIKGCLQDYQSNEEFPLLSRSHQVRVLGKLQKMRGGNVVLLFHLVDAVPFFDDDEDYTGSVDYDDFFE